MLIIHFHGIFIVNFLCFLLNLAETKSGAKSCQYGHDQKSEGGV